MSDNTSPVTIRKICTTEKLVITANTIESHRSTEVFYEPKGSTLNELISLNGITTNVLQVVKEGVCTSALYVYQLGQSSIPYAKQGTYWGYKKTSQAARTAVPYIKLGLTKIGNVLTTNSLSSQQQNDPTKLVITANTIESHRSTAVSYEPKGSTLNELISPNGTTTNTLQVVKECVCTSALYIYQLGQLPIPYVKQGTHWGYKKTSQAARTVVPYIKLGLTKIGNVLTNNSLSSQQHNNPTEKNIGAADIASTSTSDSANLPDRLVSDPAINLLVNELSSHPVSSEACSALAKQPPYCSNIASNSRVINGELLQPGTAGNNL